MEKKIMDPAKQENSASLASHSSTDNKSIGQDRQCSLSDEELVLRCRQWVIDLCKTGGRAWTLRVPVDFNRDPDMLFYELIRRFKTLLTSDKNDERIVETDAK